MAQRSGASILQRFEALPIIIVFLLLLLLFMYPAPEVFLAPYIYTTFLSTLPPLILLATGTLRSSSAREKSTFPSPRSSPFPGSSLPCCSRNTISAGSRSSRASRRSVGFGRVPQRPHHRQGRHSLVHDDARHPVLLGRHGDRAVRRQVLCVAGSRREFGVAMDCRAPFRGVDRYRLASAAVDPGAVDRDHRRLSLAHPHPPPFRRARFVHRRFESTYPASSASTSIARRSRSSR